MNLAGSPEIGLFDSFTKESLESEFSSKLKTLILHVLVILLIKISRPMLQSVCFHIVLPGPTTATMLRLGSWE